jgi:hypothetical protein
VNNLICSSGKNQNNSNQLIIPISQMIPNPYEQLLEFAFAEIRKLIMIRE